MADAAISALSAAGALDGTELLLLSQSGSDAKLALDDLADYASGWVRPSDWVALPSDAANQVAILTKVSDVDANYVAVRVSVSSGTYDVDWGDGTSSTGVTSNTNAEHLYDYDDADLAGTETSEGFKQAVIVITPNTGGATITAIALAQKHSQSGLSNYANPWLDIRANVPACTSLSFSSTSAPALLCQSIVLTAVGTVTSMGNAFDQMRNLRQCVLPDAGFGSLTSASQAFRTCQKLAHFAWPSSMTALTNASAMFNSAGLEHFAAPANALDNVTNPVDMFNGCGLLRDVDIPSGLPAATSIQAMFRGCLSLARLEIADLGAVTNITDFVRDCTSLRYVEFPTGWAGSITTTSTAFSGCPSLARIVNCEIPVSFSVASCLLSGAMLDEIYTSLPTITSQTITVSSNYGTSADDPTIATAKGWTVTGS